MNDLYRTFDSSIDNYDVYKVKDEKLGYQRFAFEKRIHIIKMRKPKLSHGYWIFFLG